MPPGAPEQPCWWTRSSRTPSAELPIPTSNGATTHRELVHSVVSATALRRSERDRKRAMTEILLFHHAHGQTQGFLAFADELRAAGHVVHAPDLYDEKTFTDLDEGVGYAKEVGFGTIAERGR